jgi:hypothetical protein
MGTMVGRVIHAGGAHIELAWGAVPYLQMHKTTRRESERKRETKPNRSWINAEKTNRENSVSINGNNH